MLVRLGDLGKLDVLGGLWRLVRAEVLVRLEELGKLELLRGLWGLVGLRELTQKLQTPGQHTLHVNTLS